MTVNRQSGKSVIKVHGHLWGSLTEGTDSVAGKFCSKFLEESTNEFIGSKKTIKTWPRLQPLGITLLTHESTERY